MKTEPIAFRKDVQPSTKETIVERIKDNGVLEEMRIRFYPGLQRDLKIMPYVLHKGSKREDLVTYPEGTETWISGDDDMLVFKINLPVEYDDELVIEAENVDAVNVYTMSVDVTIAYKGWNH